MINKSRFTRNLSVQIVALVAVLFAGQLFEAAAQNRDPFAKPAWARTREPGTAQPARPGQPGTPGASENTLGTPSIEQRIEAYKAVRAEAAANGQPLPKVTSFLTLDEMSVTGIFKTPRGYAAMVEATPIKLSYTIYPGERFFDGQLVGVEENRLVFRKVTQVARGKFVSSVENKPLREFTQREQIQGTAPVDAETERPQGQIVPQVAAIPVTSILDASERPSAAADKAPAAASKTRRPARVSRNNK